MPVGSAPGGPVEGWAPGWYQLDASALRRQVRMRSAELGYYNLFGDEKLGGAGQGALQTSRRGVFAIGDVRSGSVKRVAAAVGEGAQVVAAAGELEEALRGIGRVFDDITLRLELDVQPVAGAHDLRIDHRVEVIVQRAEVAAAVVEARREIGDLDALAVAVVQAGAQDGGVGLVLLLAAGEVDVPVQL